MRRFSGLLGKTTAGARTIGMFTGLAVSVITLWTYFFGPEPQVVAVPVRTDPPTAMSAGASPDAPRPDVPREIDGIPPAATEAALPQAQTIAARLEGDLAAWLAAGNCRHLVSVTTANLALTPASATSHGFDGAHLAVTVVVADSGSRASVTGTGKGPAAADEAYEAALAAARVRLNDALPDCHLTRHP